VQPERLMAKVPSVASMASAGAANNGVHLSWSWVSRSRWPASMHQRRLTSLRRAFGGGGRRLVEKKVPLEGGLCHDLATN